MYSGQKMPGKSFINSMKSHVHAIVHMCLTVIENARQNTKQKVKYKILINNLL